MHRIVLWILCFVFFYFETIEVSQAKVIFIGLVSNFSKPSRSSVNPFGDDFRKGVKLSLEDYNPSLIKRGYQIQLKEFDYGTENLTTIQAAQESIRQGIIAAIGFNNSKEALLAAPIFQKAQIPMITPTATSNLLSEKGAFIHTMAFSNSYSAELMARFSIDRGLKTASIIVALDCPYCIDLSKSFSDHFSKLGGTIENRIEILSDCQNVEEKLVVLKKKSHSLIVIPNYELTSARIINALQALRIRAVYLGGDSWENADGKAFFNLLKNKSIEGYFVTDWHPDIPYIISQKFSKRYSKLYKHLPNDDAVLGYDAMTFLLKGLLSAKEPTPSQLEKAMNKLKSMKGVCGMYRFRKNQAPLKSAALLRINTILGRSELERWLLPSMKESL